MTDTDKLKRLAEKTKRAEKSASHKVWHETLDEYRRQTRPDAILALIAENERLAAIEARMNGILASDCPCCVLTRAQCADTVADIEVGRGQVVADNMTLEDALEAAAKYQALFQEQRDEAVALLNKVFAQDLGSVDDDVVIEFASFLDRIDGNHQPASVANPS